MKPVKKCLSPLVGAIALACVSSGVNADILANAYALGSQNINGSAYTTLIINGESGAIANVYFTTTVANQRIGLSFSAVCTFDGGGNQSGDFVDLEIYLDNTTKLTPTNVTSAFCSKVVSTGNNQSTGFAQAFATVPTSGNHFVNVRAKMKNWGVPGTSTAWGTVSMPTISIYK